jgi:hypothetical protein
MLATPRGFEPLACPLGGGRSIQLSYGADGALLRVLRAVSRDDVRIVNLQAERLDSQSEPSVPLKPGILMYGHSVPLERPRF